MPDVKLLEVGDHYCTKQKFKIWRPDLLDQQIDDKMRNENLPSVIVEDVDAGIAVRIKESFETCNGTKVKIENIMEQAKEVWNFGDDKIYEFLGLAAQGAESFSEAKKSMSYLVTVAESRGGTEVSLQLKDSLREHGKDFFERLKVNFKKVICSEDGLYGEVVKNKITDPSVLAGKILLTILASSNLATMVAIYIAILVIRIGLETYCEKK